MKEILGTTLRMNVTTLVLSYNNSLGFLLGWRKGLLGLLLGWRNGLLGLLIASEITRWTANARNVPPAECETVVQAENAAEQETDPMLANQAGYGREASSGVPAVSEPAALHPGSLAASAELHLRGREAELDPTSAPHPSFENGPAKAPASVAAVVSKNSKGLISAPLLPRFR
jgi:hypothetical protein